MFSAAAAPVRSDICGGDEPLSRRFYGVRGRSAFREARLEGEEENQFGRFPFQLEIIIATAASTSQSEDITAAAAARLVSHSGGGANGAEGWAQRSRRTAIPLSNRGGVITRLRQMNRDGVVGPSEDRQHGEWR